MPRGPITLVAVCALLAGVVVPATAAGSQSQQVEIDMTALQIPAGADVRLTWQGQLEPTYVQCKTEDTTQNDGLITALTASCWAVESQIITVTVTHGTQSVSAQLSFTSPTPSGSARDYRLMRSPRGQVLKFKSCRQIPVRVNPGTAPVDPHMRFATQFAVEQVAQASGLPLVFKGISRYMPRRSTQPPGRGIWIGYAYPGRGKGRSDLLTRGNRDELGIGGPYYSGRTIISGQLVLSRKNLARFGGPPLLIETIMHELAHTLGVDHASARGQQIMAPVASGEANVTWGRGDLRALKKVGPGTVCSSQL